MSEAPLRPAEFAQLAHASIAASESRRRRRQRDTEPDRVGLEMKLDLLAAIEAADPDPEEFERFLLEYALQPGRPSGPVRGVCSDLWLEWETVVSTPAYADWLRAGGQEIGDEVRSPGRAGQREHFRPDRGDRPIADTTRHPDQP